jgi:hypothetical protein
LDGIVVGVELNAALLRAVEAQFPQGVNDLHALAWVRARRHYKDGICGRIDDRRGENANLPGNVSVSKPTHVPIWKLN